MTRRACLVRIVDLAGRAVEVTAQVMVKATAAAATIRTAVAAVRTVTQVASLASSQVRRVLKATCLGGTIGMAGRGSTGMEALLDANAQETHTGSPNLEPSALPAYSAAPARNAAMSMMKPVDNHTTSIGMTEIMGVTHRPVHEE